MLRLWFANDTIIVAQVFLETMEGCHLFLSPFFVMQTRVFRDSPSAIVQIFVSPGGKDGLPLVSLTRLTAARLRSSARSRSSSCSLVSLARFWRSAHNSCCLAAASSRARISWALFSRLKGSASNPFSDDIVASNTYLSFDIFFSTQNLVKWRSFTKFPRHVCAFTQKSRQNCRIPMTSGWRPWQTDRETPRELTASCHLRGEDAKNSTLRVELFASIRVPNISPLTRGNTFFLHTFLGELYDNMIHVGSPVPVWDNLTSH